MSDHALDSSGPGSLKSTETHCFSERDSKSLEQCVPKLEAPQVLQTALNRAVKDTNRTNSWCVARIKRSPLSYTASHRHLLPTRQARDALRPLQPPRLPQATLNPAALRRRWLGHGSLHWGHWGHWGHWAVKTFVGCQMRDPYASANTHP